MSALLAATTAANGTGLVPWRYCDVHTRSTFNILSLCLSTLIICVWNAVHPDVPFHKKSRWRVHRTRFYGFLIGLFLPEVLVLNALDEFLKARWLLHKMNRTKSGSGFAILFWTKILTISFWTEAWRPNVFKKPKRAQWTMTHAFYAVMDGFVAKSDSGQVTVLRPGDIVALCKYKRMRPLFAADGLDDRSKAGPLTKALFCWQLLVFGISCVARQAEHLPLSFLEVTTLAHSLCGLAAFALWWYKPHSVDEVVVVPVDDALKWKITWSEDADSEFTALRGLNLVLYGRGDNLTKAVFSALLVAALYGLPHLLALSTEFPTFGERLCWQAATTVIVCAPGMWVAVGWASGRVTGHQRFLDRTLAFIVLGSIVAYPISSCFIVAESFLQIFALPSGVFNSPVFVCYLPHFS